MMDTSTSTTQQQRWMLDVFCVFELYPLLVSCSTLSSPQVLRWAASVHQTAQTLIVCFVHIQVPKRPMTSCTSLMHCTKLSYLSFWVKRDEATMVGRFSVGEFLRRPDSSCQLRYAHALFAVKDRDLGILTFVTSWILWGPEANKGTMAHKRNLAIWQDKGWWSWMDVTHLFFSCLSHSKPTATALIRRWHLPTSIRKLLVLAKGTVRLLNIELVPFGPQPGITMKV